MKPRICVPITAATTKTAIAQIAKANRLADIIELRLDYTQEPDIPRLVKACRKPVIATARSRKEGGRLKLAHRKRSDMLLQAIRSGADFADIELSSPPAFRKGLKCRVILSYHNFRETPKDLRKIYGKIKEQKPFIAKIATYARTQDDQIRLLDLLCQAKEDKQRLIVVAMGPNGRLSRIIGPFLGSYLTYASLGPESAPGQISIVKLKKLYKYLPFSAGG